MFAGRLRQEDRNDDGADARFGDFQNADSGGFRFVAPDAAPFAPNAAVAPNRAGHPLQNPRFRLQREFSDDNGDLDHPFPEQKACRRFAFRIQDIVETRQQQHAIADLQFVVDSDDGLERIGAIQLISGHVRENDADLGNALATERAGGRVRNIAELFRRFQNLFYRILLKLINLIQL